MSNLDFWKGTHFASRSFVDDVWQALHEIENDRVVPAERQRRLADQSITPACDVVESEDAFLLTMDVPGLKREDITVEVTGQQLSISAERRREEKKDQGSFQRIERSYGKYFRTFQLPEGTNTDAIDASYENGVLKLAVPKAATSKTRKVAITEGGIGLLRRLTGKSEAKLVNG